MPLHMIKLCVGCDTVEELLEWRQTHNDPDGHWIMRTRQTPKRATELVDGGSLYRVFKGMILCRQAILRVDTVGEGLAARCRITVSPEIVRVLPTPRRAFQGWRYLDPAEAPADIDTDTDVATLPTDLAARLRELGAW